jgi:RNA polymerase sigma factor (sigma-70 family)
MTAHSSESVLTPQFARTAVRLAMLRTGTALGEDDLAQEALLRGLKAFRRTDHVEHPSAFFSKIVRDTVRDHWRRHHVLLPLDLVRQDELARASNIEEGLHRSEQISRIREVFRELPTAQRELLELFYLEGLSLKELSRRRGKSRSAVKMALLRGRNKVIQAMTPLDRPNH